MTSIELKNIRLEREQHDLMRVIGNVIDDVQMLLRHVDTKRLSQAECITILAHHKHAIQVMADIMEGK